MVVKYVSGLCGINDITCKLKEVFGPRYSGCKWPAAKEILVYQLHYPLIPLIKTLKEVMYYFKQCIRILDIELNMLASLCWYIKGKLQELCKYVLCLSV